MYNMFLAEGSSLDIDTMLTTATKVFNWVLGVVSDQPLLAAAFGMAVLVPAGIASFRSIKSAV